MTMAEMVAHISFMLGFPANENIEGLQIESAITIAFNELKRYMKTPVDKTVPYSRKIDLKKVGIDTKRVLNVFASRPRIGLTLGSIESGNVFQVAASVNTQSSIGNVSRLNLDPIMTEMAMAQVRNTLSTDFQWTYDLHNQLVYVTHRDPQPSSVTVRYVPDYKDVAEIENPTWINYLLRLGEANMKKALGRTRSKFTIEGSNVSLDGELLLEEANAELEAIRTELNAKKHKAVILN